jgi:hypothetical protein
MLTASRLPRLLLLVAALLASPCVVGCDALSSLGAPKVLEIDEPRLLTEVDARAAKAAGGTAVEAEMDATLEAVAKDPALAAAGEALLAKLGQAPEVAQVGGAIVAKLGESKEMIALMQKLAAENPGATPDELGAIVGKRVDAATSGPAFDKAFDDAFEVLLAKPAVSGAFDRFGTAVANNTHMTKALHDVVSTGLTDAEATKRLTVLNSGAFPDKSRATDLLLEHAFTEARFEAFFVELFRLDATRRHLAVALTKLMKSPTVLDRVAKAVGTIMTDPGFEKAAMAVMMTMLSDNPTTEGIAAGLTPILSSPATEAALVALIDGALADPGLQAIGDQAVAAIASDAEVVAALKKLLVDW